MSLRVCLDCTTAFAVGAPRCPHCRSERHASDREAERLGVRHGIPVDIKEDDMPKITRHGGPSVTGEEPEAAAEPEAVEEPAAEVVSEEPKKAPQRRTRSK